MEPVSIGGAIGGAFGCIGTAWRRAWLVMALLVLLQALEGLARVAAPGPTASVVVLLAFVPLVALSTAALGALYRTGIGAEHSTDYEYRLAPGGLQWTAVEWRVLGANILLGLILGGIGVVVLLIWGVALGLSMAGQIDQLNAVNAAASNAARLAAFGRLMIGPGGVATVAILGPALVLFLWLNAKLSLFTVLAADTKRFDLGEAWRLTRGALAALIIATVVIWVAEFLVGVIFGFIGGAIAFGTGRAGAGGTIGGVLGGIAGAAINVPLSAGLQIYVYGQRRSGAATVAAAFS